jgi:hypothetical protein
MTQKKSCGEHEARQIKHGDLNTHDLTCLHPGQRSYPTEQRVLEIELFERPLQQTQRSKFTIQSSGCDVRRQRQDNKRQRQRLNGKRKRQLTHGT